MAYILGQVLVFILRTKTKEKKRTISSLPRVLIISLNTLALTFALQSGHLTLAFFLIIKGTIKVPYRMFKLHFDTITL